MLHALRRWWKVAAPLGIVLAAAATAIVFLTFKPVYRAVGQIRILETQPYVAFPAQRGGESKRFVATQLQLLRLPIVLYEVAYDPEVATQPEIREEPDPVEYLQREINAKVIGESEIYQVEYEASDPNHAKQVVDKLIASYIRYLDKHDAELRAKLRMSLDTEMERRVRATEMLQDEVRRLSEQAGVTPSQATIAAAQALSPSAVSEVRSLLVQAEVDIIMTKAAIDFQRERDNEPVRVPESELNARIDAELLPRRQELESQRRTVEDLKPHTSGNASPTAQPRTGPIGGGRSSDPKCGDRAAPAG